LTAQASPFASVIICTRNRSASLARTLQSIVQAAHGIAETWELIVVDNGSTDATPEVVASFEDRLPVNLVKEPRAGLSNARNAGVAAARGNYILWTDDDVVVDVNWLRAWLAAFRERPDDAVFGGRTEPLYEEPRQSWFIESQAHLGSLLAIRDEPVWVSIAPDRVPYGLNYAVRGIEQRKHPYDPDLGVAPGRRRGGEEVAVIRQILAEGGRGSWVWNATVRHVIPTERQSERYIRTFYRALGFVHPIGGLTATRKRKIRVLGRTVYVLARSSAAILLARMGWNRPIVPLLIVQAKALGSLERHLGEG
jgi:glycosyltransferase involved in cell wall biosynthesis